MITLQHVSLSTFTDSLQVIYHILLQMRNVSSYLFDNFRIERGTVKWRVKASTLVTIQMLEKVACF